jgi:hypothetical protein
MAIPFKVDEDGVGGDYRVTVGALRGVVGGWVGFEWGSAALGRAWGKVEVGEQDIAF